ncbi:MAG: M20 family metallopeptidase [Chthonomonadales bacterium]|nr:M20 family metallopeptidase [Chthonomonadales bacterium]
MTDWLDLQTAERLLSDLVAIPSVNPMGRPFTGSAPVERGVADYLEHLFAPYPVRMSRMAPGPMHESLLVEAPGRADGPCALFESHMDTVPADDWSDRAFEPRSEDGMLIGRGACDDKGPLLAMALALLDLLEHGERPAMPVLLMAAGDEEFGQTGIKQFRATERPVAFGVFGEPTRMAPVVQHKGTVRWDVTVHGRSAHTSRPELGENAILGAMRVIEALASHQEALQERHVSPLTTGPTITVTMIAGGRTRNAVPDECTLAVDFRVVPGMDPLRAREEAMRALDATGLPITHSEVQLWTPALDTPPNHPLVVLALEACRRHAGDGIAVRGEPYGTDAAWIADRAPAIVLGPGDIAHAHAVDERVSIAALVACARIYRELMAF